MNMRFSRIIILSAVVALAAVAFLMASGGPALAQETGQPVVELAQRGSANALTVPSTFQNQKISGANTTTKQAYKFQRQREGRDFSYTVANLQPGVSYNVELSFVEHDEPAAGRRVFNVYLQDLKEISLLDIYGKAGQNTAYQETRTVTASAASPGDPGGRISVRLRSDQAGCVGEATVSTVRIYRGAINAVEIDAAASRLNMDVPTRFGNGPGQDCHETTLGRMGSRFGLNLLPQKLGARFSPLGDGTGDLADLVIGLDPGDGSGLKCLPFTDRYPVWDGLTLTTTMTSQTYECLSAGCRFTVSLRSPFYPGDEKVSGAPFLYIDVRVENIGDAPFSPRFVLARPHSRGFDRTAPAALPAGPAGGFTTSSACTYWDETSNDAKAVPATEALAVPADEAGDVEFVMDEAGFEDFSADRLWGIASPAGYPRTYSDYKKPLFTFYPRGYTGATWQTPIPAGESREKHFVLAGHVGSKVLKVSNDSYKDNTFRFKYARSFDSVKDVVDYAVGERNSGDDLEGKSEMFDSVFFSPDYLSLSDGYSEPVRRLIAYSFQSFVMNTWSAVSDYGREWFSTWEGSSCRFHSTIDMEYNSSWFYFSLWPEKMRLLLEEWLLYPNTCQQGKYLSHDMGIMDRADGQAYPNDMPVEENADYVLLLYKYWKATGDTAFMRSKFPVVRELVDFIANCDVNGNGLPDLHTGNTLDQSTLALQFGKDQSYLGVKCLAAHSATREMALAQDFPDLEYSEKCRGQVEAINEALERDMWLSDHFAVCFDSDVLREDREAYSIYASNGLGWLMSGSRHTGLTSRNEARLRLDLVNSAARTLRTYGCTHSSHDAYNEWVSQNIWRDQVAAMLGVEICSDNPLAMAARYWSLQRYFARSMWGGFWDVVIYPGGGGAGGGPSSRLTPALPGRGAEDGAPGGAGGGARRPADDTGGGAYRQSLGYYPRGITSLGLIDAFAGLTLDAPAGALYYRVPTDVPATVPVLSRADWAAGRVPTLTFPAPGTAPVVTCRDLLPPTVLPNEVHDITGVRSSSHALSPNGDGVNETATVRYTLPFPATVEVSVWEGSEMVRGFPPVEARAGETSVTWDGRDSGGKAVRDGVYTVRIDASPRDGSRVLRPAAATVNVNSSIPDLSREWYLAEGFTGGEFEEYIVVQNPGGEARLRVTFMLEGGGTVARGYTVPAASRFTIVVDDILPDAQVSAMVSADAPVAVERAMYFNGRRAGHASVGACSPSRTWYLAEGYTGEGFDEYVLVMNPGDSEAALEVTFMTPNAGNRTREYRVPPRSRFTIHVNRELPGQSVSTKVESNRPVVVERAQYLNDMTAGTCSIGAASTSRTWYLAEGYTDQGFETWVVLQNPEKSYNNVTLVFMESDGTNTVKRYLLPPESRFTVLVNAYLERSEVSVKVRSEKPVLAERAMYWSGRSDGHACIGTPTPDEDWYLPEGYTDQGFETWVTVQNPGDETRRLTATFMEPGGRNTVREYTLSPRSRFTIGVDGVLPAAEVSTKISADGPVIVERSVYFSGRAGGAASPGVRGSD